MLKSPEQPAKPSKGKESLEGCIIEYDSCARGKLEIYKDKVTGEVVKMKIIR